MLCTQGTCIQVCVAHSYSLIAVNDCWQSCGICVHLCIIAVASCVCMFMYVWVSVCMYACVYVYACMYVRVSARVCMYLYAWVYMCVCMWCVCVHIMGAHIKCIRVCNTSVSHSEALRLFLLPIVFCVVICILAPFPLCPTALSTSNTFAVGSCTQDTHSRWRIMSGHALQSR